MSEESESTTEGKADGGLGVFLAGDRTKVAEMNTLRRAARARWVIPDGAREKAAEILMKIAVQETATVATANGEIEVSNARNQIAAVRTLATLDQLNQSDEHLADKNERMDQGKPTDRIAYQPPPEYDLPIPDSIRERLIGGH